MNAPELSLPNFFPSSIASLMITFTGTSGRWSISCTASRSTFRSTRAMRSSRQCVETGSKLLQNRDSASSRSVAATSIWYSAWTARSRALVRFAWAILRSRAHAREGSIAARHRLLRPLPGADGPGGSLERVRLLDGRDGRVRPLVSRLDAGALEGLLHGVAGEDAHGH